MPRVSSLRGEGQLGRAEPSPADPGRGGPSRTHCASSDGTSLFAVAPASYDTHFKKEEENSPRSRSRRGAPFSVSEVISNSSADVGSALRRCRRCVCALVLCPVSVPYSSVGTRIIQLFWGKCACWRERSIPAGEISDHVSCAFVWNSVFASVRIPGGVAHIEIGVEVNKWESGLASELENSVLRFSTALQA